MYKDYSDYRDLAQTGDLALCVGSGKLSEGIIASAKRNRKKPAVIDRKKVYYSHIGVIVKLYENIFILEAVGKGVVLRRFSEAYKSYNGRIDIYRPRYTNLNDTFVPGSNICLDLFMKELLLLEGSKYDRKAIIKQLLNEIKIFKQKHKEDGEYFCSEAINYAACYYWGGEDVWVTPQDIGYKEWKNQNYVYTLRNIN